MNFEDNEPGLSTKDIIQTNGITKMRVIVNWLSCGAQTRRIWHVETCGQYSSYDTIEMILTE